MKNILILLAIVGVLMLMSSKVSNNPTEAFAIAADPGQALMQDMLVGGVVLCLFTALLKEARGGK